MTIARKLPWQSITFEKGENRLKNLTLQDERSPLPSMGGYYPALFIGNSDPANDNKKIGNFVDSRIRLGPVIPTSW